MIRAIVLTMPFFLLAFCVHAQKLSGLTPPSDFKITIIAGGVAPWTTLSKVEIDAQGHGVYYTMSADDRDSGEFKKANAFIVDKISLQTVYGAVAKADFLNLKEQYVDQGALGGSFAEITVNLHGKTHTVRTQNSQFQAFDDIIIAINLATPKDNKIRYNAIL